MSCPNCSYNYSIFHENKLLYVPKIPLIQVDVKRAVPKDQPQERCHKIFVGGLPETNEAELKSFFEKHGKVTQCQFKRDQNTGRGRGFGFVSFEDSDTVDKLVILKVLPTLR